MKTIEQTSLEQKYRDAIATAGRSLKAKFPILEVILFGSRARGDADEHSDIDLMLITRETIHWKEEKAIVDLLFEIGLEYDVIFTPFVVSEAEWNTEPFRSFPIYKEIERDGAMVA